jgi:hypothetical protein
MMNAMSRKKSFSFLVIFEIPAFGELLFFRSIANFANPNQNWLSMNAENHWSGLNWPSEIPYNGA